jgi:hypothetical protein
MTCIEGPGAGREPIAAAIGAQSSVAHVLSPLPHESSEDYPAAVAMLDDKTRVIECANGIQWIVQRRRGRTWHSIYFCRTKAGLLLYATPITPELIALPDYFPARFEHRCMASDEAVP